MTQYFDLDGLANLFFEDSFVLAVEEAEDKLCFALEVVLTEAHPNYDRPKDGELYCYKKGFLTFSNLKSVKWLAKEMRPTTDIDGSVDYGNIDIFESVETGYHLQGDWGEVLIDSSLPVLDWMEE